MECEGAGREHYISAVPPSDRSRQRRLICSSVVNPQQEQKAEPFVSLLITQLIMYESLCLYLYKIHEVKNSLGLIHNCVPSTQLDTAYIGDQ